MGRNRLYRNNKNGRFTDIAATSGVVEPIASFPTWFWDFDNDGRLDLFVASYTGRIDTLASHYLGEKSEFEMPGVYRNTGKGYFENVAEAQGLAFPMLPMGSNFGDLDGDGYLDFYLGTGDPDYHTLMPNVMFLNQEGKGFVDVTMAGGFGQLQKGHGIAFADLDNDGDLDVFEQMGGAFGGDRFGDALFENPGFGANWITVKLVGQTTNRSAIGARIRVEIEVDGKTRSIYRFVNSGGSFGSSPLQQTIPIGKAKSIKALEIYWPVTGRAQTFTGVKLNQSILVIEDSTQARVIGVKRLKLGG
jgi:FG-GAP-like repeat/ASPIC and UnbV